MLNFAFLNTHELYMQRCLQLARLGAGAVAPNPMVGAVLVYEDKIIGEGYHQKFGEVHAEVNCINSVNNKNKQYISKSILYISLEPCSHFGKTPPCADLIIKNKIPEVVIGCLDVFSEVNGEGIKKLESAGINVIVNVLQKDAAELNKRFFTFHQQCRPYIILKWAQSSDGKIAGINYAKVSISNEYTTKLVHKWRSEDVAIMVGTNTTLQDNPYLTTRYWTGKNPVRLIVDINLKLPSSLHIFDAVADTIIFNAHQHKKEKNIFYYKIDKQKNYIQQILQALYALNIQSIIVEGGARLLQSFIDENMWDETRIIMNTELIIGKGITAPVLTSQLQLKKEILLSDTITYYSRIHND